MSSMKKIIYRFLKKNKVGESFINTVNKTSLYSELAIKTKLSRALTNAFAAVCFDNFAECVYSSIHFLVEPFGTLFGTWGL